MRVVILTTDFLPNIGGIAAHVDGLSRGLVEWGCAVTVVVPRRRRLLPRLGVHREPGDPYPVVRLDVPQYVKFGRFVHPRLTAAWLRREIRATGAAVLHWHTFDYLTVRLVRGVARVFTNHTSQFLEYAADPRRRALARALVGPAHRVIAPSRELAAATASTGFPEERLTAIPNGVDIRRFSPAVDGRQLRARLEFSASDCVVLCPRRLEKKNGVIYWVRAIPLLLARCRKPLRFLFVGDYTAGDVYSARKEVLDAIAGLGLGDRIVFAGSVPNREMPAYVAAADIVVLPSLIEATSIAGLEAMATGKPLAATAVGGLPEIVEDGRTGLLVPPADPGALAEAVLRLATDSGERSRMGQAARARAERDFGWSTVAQRTIAVYEAARGDAGVNA